MALFGTVKVLDKMNKEELAAFAKSLDPPVDKELYDQSHNNKDIVEAIRAHMATHNLAEPKEDEAQSALMDKLNKLKDKFDNARKTLGQVERELEELSVLTKPIPPSRLYLTPKERQFREEVHGRIKALWGVVGKAL